MNYRNDETGELASGDCIGTDASGEKLYQVREGWTPVEPYWLDADGYAHEGEQPPPGVCRYCHNGNEACVCP
jgi:hypothetical protein